MSATIHLDRVVVVDIVRRQIAVADTMRVDTNQVTRIQNTAAHLRRMPDEHAFATDVWRRQQVRQVCPVPKRIVLSVHR